MSSREKWLAFQAGLYHDVVTMTALWVQKSWSMAVIIQSWCHHFPQTSSSSFVPYLRGTNINVIVYPRILLPLPPAMPTTSPTFNKSCQLYFIILFQNPSCFLHLHHHFLGLGSTHMTSFYLNYIFKIPISKYSNILRYQRLGCQRMNFWETQFTP